MKLQREVFLMTKIDDKKVFCASGICICALCTRLAIGLLLQWSASVYYYSAVHITPVCDCTVHRWLILSIGEYGIVYKAHLLPKAGYKKSSYASAMPDTVAVKTLKGNLDFRSDRCCKFRHKFLESILHATTHGLRMFSDYYPYKHAWFGLKMQ